MHSPQCLLLNMTSKRHFLLCNLVINLHLFYPNSFQNFYFPHFVTCIYSRKCFPSANFPYDLELWPTIFTNELNLDSVKLNQHLGKWLFSKVIVGTLRQTDTHTTERLLYLDHKWSVMSTHRVGPQTQNRRLSTKSPSHASLPSLFCRRSCRIRDVAIGVMDAFVSSSANKRATVKVDRVALAASNRWTNERISQSTGAVDFGHFS